MPRSYVTISYRGRRVRFSYESDILRPGIEKALASWRIDIDDIKCVRYHLNFYNLLPN